MGIALVVRMAWCIQVCFTFSFFAAGCLCSCWTSLFSDFATIVDLQSLKISRRLMFSSFLQIIRGFSVGFRCVAFQRRLCIGRLIRWSHFQQSRKESKRLTPCFKRLSFVFSRCPVVSDEKLTETCSVEDKCFLGRE